MLLLAGRHEFLDPRDTSNAPRDTLAGAFIEAYERMGYDGVYPDMAEADWLAENAGTLPPFIQPVGLEGMVDTFTVGERTVKVVVYPAPARGPFPTDAQIAWADATIADLEQEAALVVGICGWSKTGELKYLEEAAHPPDILLGGGPGPGHPEMLANNGETLWARSFTKGRVLNKITIYEWPARDAERVWHLGMNIEAESLVLGESIRGDEAIDALFHP